MTSNLALGANNAIESVAVLANHLHALLCKTVSPTTKDLEQTFASFQKQRKTRTSQAISMTGDYTRRATWESLTAWFLQQYMAPLKGDKLIARWIIAPWVRDGVKLNFVEESNPVTGKVPWADTNMKARVRVQVS